ncbi:hypothetical protein KXD40_003194 [Peronospora effusa]|nr:hypothetical protein KXD40_003194 [Peronospora effusa]
MTRTGIGVVATRPIPAGGVSQYVLDPPREAAYTVELRQRDTKAHRVYVSAEECGSVARFVEHSCTPNTHFHEVRGRRRVVVSLVAQSDIASGTEVIVDYTGQTNSALWFHCQCALHQNENRDALRATAMKKETPEEGDYPMHRDYGKAVHLRSRVMKQWKKNFGLAQRAMTLPSDTAGIDTREELAARRKCGKDGQEDAGRGESEGCPTWWPGRSSTRVWWCPAPNEGRKRAAQRDDEEEIREEIDLTQADSDDKEPANGTRDWILQKYKVRQQVPWPTDVRRVTMVQNPYKISFNIPGAREEKCGCEGRCEIATCPNAAEKQVCETVTCTPGAKACDNQF